MSSLASLRRVVPKRLGLQFSSTHALEYVDQLHFFSHPTHPGLLENQIGTIRQPQRRKSLGLGATDISGSRCGAGIGIFVVANQGTPMFLPGPLDRVPNVPAHEWHGVRFRICPTLWK